MAAADELRGFHFTVATDSLGGTSIGRVRSYEFTLDTGAAPSYALGDRDPYVVGEGNRSYSGTLTMAFRDIAEVLTLITQDPQTADTHYIRGSTGVSGTETVDITLSGVKYVSWSMNPSNDGEVVEEVVPFQGTGIAVAETTI